MVQTYELRVVDKGTNQVVQAFRNATLPFAAIGKSDLWSFSQSNVGEVLGVWHTFFEQDDQRHQRTTILVGKATKSLDTQSGSDDPFWPHASAENQ